MTAHARKISPWDPEIFRGAVRDSFLKFDPRVQIKNPVMFIVEIGSLLSTFVFVNQVATGTGNPLFTGQVSFWLWFTVLFANLAETMAEGRGKPRAATGRQPKAQTLATRLLDDGT